jgi:adenylate cyclase
LASRLTGTNKFYGTQIILSEACQIKLKGRLPTRVLDTVAVKGKTKGVRIFELLSEGSSEKKVELSKQFTAAYFDLYLKKEFAKAMEEFETYLKEYPGDVQCKNLIDRCARYLSEPPEKGWTGVHVMKTK